MVARSAAQGMKCLKSPVFVLCRILEPHQACQAAEEAEPHDAEQRRTAADWRMEAPHAVPAAGGACSTRCLLFGACHSSRAQVSCHRCSGQQPLPTWHCDVLRKDDPVVQQAMHLCGSLHHICRKFGTFLLSVCWFAVLSVACWLAAAAGTRTQTIWPPWHGHWTASKPSPCAPASCSAATCQSLLAPLAVTTLRWLCTTAS